MANREELNNNHLHFKSRVLDLGPVPPSAGPNRLNYLDVRGRAALKSANDEFETALMVLGAAADLAPVMHEPLVEHDRALRVAVQRDKLAAWESFRNVLDQALIDAVEPHIRESEESAVAALNYLDDHELQETAHHAVHRAAFVRRGLFGCPITLDEDGLWTACSFRLAHWRFGLSVGMSTDYVCAICDRLVEDCNDHQTGQTYEMIATKAADGTCTICIAMGLEAKPCSHVANSRYPVVAYGIARHATIHEISMVPRPRYPQARITAIQTLTDLSPDDEPRARRAATHGLLDCNFCCGPCDGYITSPEF